MQITFEFAILFQHYDYTISILFVFCSAFAGMQPITHINRYVITLLQHRNNSYATCIPPYHQPHTPLQQALTELSLFSSSKSPCGDILLSRKSSESSELPPAMLDNSDGLPLTSSSSSGVNSVGCATYAILRREFSLSGPSSKEDEPRASSEPYSSRDFDGLKLPDGSTMSTATGWTGVKRLDLVDLAALDVRFGRTWLPTLNTIGESLVGSVGDCVEVDGLGSSAGVSLKPERLGFLMLFPIWYGLAASWVRTVVRTGVSEVVVDGSDEGVAAELFFWLSFFIKMFLSFSAVDSECGFGATGEFTTLSFTSSVSITLSFSSRGREPFLSEVGVAAVG